jgi:hypothetical protein
MTRSHNMAVLQLRKRFNREAVLTSSPTLPKATLGRDDNGIPYRKAVVSIPNVFLIPIDLMSL